MISQLRKYKFLFQKGLHFFLLPVLLIVSIILYTSPIQIKADAVYNFAFKIGKTGTDNGRGIIIDKANSFIYTTGAFSSTLVDFNPATGTNNELSSAGNTDTYLAKYDLNGNYLWAIGLPGAGTENPIAMDLDSSGNIYITGAYNNQTNFNPNGTSVNLNPVSIGANDIFVAKYNPSGILVWARSMGGALNDVGIGIAVDSYNNVYTTGYFNTNATYPTADFDPGAGTANLTSFGGNDIFVSKLDSDGNFVFAKQFGGTGADVAYGIDVDSSGNIYTTGYFNGTASFLGPSSLTASGSNSDIFVSKLNSDGTYNFAFKIGASTVDTAQYLQLDSSGNIYITGSFTGTSVDFDPGAGNAPLNATGATADIFLAKYNSSGTYQSAYKFGGTGADLGYSITFDANSNVYLTGSFAGSNVDFDPGTGTSTLTSVGLLDIFIVKLSSSGVFDFAKGMGGVGNDIGYSISLDSNSNVYTTGSFSNTVDFDPDPNTPPASLTSAGGTDTFVSRLNQTSNASVNITPSTDVLIDEGSTNASAYSVVLGSAPSSNVTITISETSPAVTLNTPSLTFTTANWNTPQSVSITGATDSDLVDSNDQLITFDISSSDSAYNALPDQTRQVDINDTTVASFSVTPATDFAITEGQSGLVAYNVVLGAQPATDVVINISENPASSAITLNTTSLTFTNANWNSAQPVLVSAPEEANINSEQNQPLLFSINDTSSDNNFDPLADQTRNIDVTDNDTPGFTVTETGGVTSVIEEGSADSFSIVLNSQPTGNVRLDLTSSDTTALTLSVPYVEFSTVDWNVAKNITASGINDADTDSETGTIDIAINQGATADPNYDTLPSQSINFSVTDNDAPVDVVVFENKLPTINGGSVTQKKSGSLKVGGITSTAYVRFDGLLKIPLGASDGKVLTSDADGDATWQTISSSPGTTTWGSIGTSNGPILSSPQSDLINILNAKANLVSPVFLGSPKSNEVLLSNDNDTSVATTAFVISKIGSGSGAGNGWSRASNTVSLATLADSVSIGELSIVYKGSSVSDNNRFLHNNGIGNLFLGLTSGSLNLTGNYNTGVGQETLSGLNSYISGSKNTGFGYQALSKGDNWFNNNTAFGSKALGGGATYGGGIYNTAIGYESLLNTYSNNGTSTGILNTGVGYQALKNNTTGSYNVAVGSGALVNNTTGNYNIAIGYGAGPTTGNLHNTVAIGYGTTVDQSNKIRLGNSSISVVEFQVIPSIVSDLRLKENINDIDLGLEFIKKLRPVSYTLKGGKGIDYGFIAQEVENAIGKDTNLVLTDNTDFRGKTMRYEGLIAPLVKAVLEQDTQLQNDKKDLEDFEKRLVELENKLK